MMDCTKQKGPCSAPKLPKPPPCPPPPPKKFPWIYPISVAAFLAFVGTLYRLYLYKERLDREAPKPVWRPRPKKKNPYHDKDLPACVQYLIVGTGPAGWAAYRSIMEHDKTAKVFFISKEDSYPYKRPPMSKLMWWNGEPPDIRHLNYVDASVRRTMYYAECKRFMDPVKFYRKPIGPAVSAAMGWCVLRVDADEHVVWVKTMCGEQPIYYERCLLATGSKPNNIPAFKNASKFVRERVCRLRTIRDLEIAYRRVREAEHVTVIGGGPLGVELAYYMGRMPREWNPQPDDEEYVPPRIYHLYKDKGILAGIIPEYLGVWAAEKLKCENVTLIPKAQVYDAFETPDGKLELTLSNGTSIKTDYVFLCVGATPRVEVAKESFLEVDHINGGFKVNTELEARTHLYVAGDAASLYSQWKDSRMRMEHYLNAIEQGHIAGQNMTGYWTPCNMEPHYWIDLDKDLNVEVVGEVGACMPTVGIFKPCAGELTDEEGRAYEKRIGEYDRPCFSVPADYRDRYKRGMLFYLRDEIVVGMLFWNFPPIEDRLEVATELLRARPHYEEISLLAELLGFPELQCVYVPEEEVPKPPVCLKGKTY